MELFQNLDLLVKEENLSIDFQYVIKLVKQLVIYQKEEFINIKIEKLKDYIWNNEIESIKQILEEIMQADLNERQVENILYEIPNLLDNDQYDIANYINDSIEKKIYIITIQE